MPVTSKTDLEVDVMTKEQYENERKYQGTMAIADSLRRRGVISDEEYCQIDTKFQGKYKVKFSTLFTDIGLINPKDYGNM